MANGELWLRFATQAELEAEHAQNLRFGRAFAKGETGLALFSAMRLCIEHPTSGAQKALGAEVVMVLDHGPVPGVALQFLDRSQAAMDDLAAFVAAGEPMWAEPGDGMEEIGPGDAADNEAEDVAEDDAEETAGATPGQRNLSRERQAKLRNLPPAERLKVAHGPVLEDRVLLERIYGSGVWEPLLRNPKITIPEVARMARKGMIPRPLLDLIAENETWIRQSIVRRSLLSNPRLTTESAMRVLRTVPARELKLVPQQTAYPAVVRAAAQRLMRGG